MGIDERVVSGQDIVCLAHEPWHGPWKTYQQVMSLLAQRNRVLYVGPPASLRQGIDELRKRERRPPILERVAPTLFVYHEPRLLAKARETRWLGRWFNRVTSQLRLAHIRALARRAGFVSPILWVFDPTMTAALGAFREKLLVYHVLDRYVEFFPPEAIASRERVAAGEARMLASADIVFVVSPSLRDRCLKRNPNVFVVPNGVDYDRFQAAIATAGPPYDMRSLRRPIVGYVGAIQSFLDFTLLGRVANECRDCALVLVGPEELGGERGQLDALLSHSNVHYLGLKTVDEVPVYMRACDICIMPYHPNTLTVPDSDSIKLYEYLACGRPIVSTDVPSSRRFVPLVRIATDGDEFVRCIREGLGEDAHWPQLRMASAREHSWQRRVEIMSEVIRQRLDTRDTLTPPLVSEPTWR